MKISRLIYCNIFFLSLLTFYSKAQELNHKLASVYVYNFTKYIEWPNEKKNGSFVIAVYGNSPIFREFNNFISTKKVGNQSISLKSTTSLDGLYDCNLVYVPLSESKNIKLISDALLNKPILIISEKPGSAKKGASINLFLDEDDDYKTKFDLNKKLIEDKGLIISKQLIQMADKVE